MDIFGGHPSSVKRALFSSQYEKNARRQRGFVTWVPENSLLAMHTDHTNLGILLVPVSGNGIKNQAKVALLPRLDRSGRDRLDIDVWLAGPDKAERHGQPLSILANITMESDLNGDRGECSVTRIGELAVDICDFRPGKGICLAHLETADG